MLNTKQIKIAQTLGSAHEKPTAVSERSHSFSVLNNNFINKKKEKQSGQGCDLTYSLIELNNCNEDLFKSLAIYNNN